MNNYRTDDYYVGLDMGTSTVGWAVTDTKYNLLRFKGKDMWGIREFEEASTAVDRRTKRIARRNRQRQQVRVGLVKSYFDQAIQEVDPNFFARLENSKYHIEDKDEAVRTPNGIFDDENYKDADYFKEYPTIFHLRKELIENPKPHDVRLVFLAILNIFKHRGHFLNAGIDTDGNADIWEAYQSLHEELSNICEIELPQGDSEEFKKILEGKGLSRSKKKDMLIELLNLGKQQKKETEIIKAICGLKVDAKKIFEDADCEENTSIDFSSTSFEEKEDELRKNLGDDNFELVLDMKSVYDAGLLSGILKGEEYLSFSRVNSYNKHHDDLRKLKKVIRKYFSEDAYDEMFRSEGNGTYSAYVNSYNSGKVARRGLGARTRDDFYKKVKALLQGIDDADSDVNEIFEDIENDTFMPKQLTFENGVIPNQVHEKELKKILKNAESYLPFLIEKDESGLSVSERIDKLFTFRVPYYVGPVTEKSAEMGGNGWVIRKASGDVLPWNIDEKIDIGATSEKFIERLIRQCTYMNGKSVMPKSSLLYEAYCVLNEINNLRIDGERIEPELKKDIYKDLFMSGKRITRKKLESYLAGRGIVSEKEQLSGIDININNSLSSWGKMSAVLGDTIKTDSGFKTAEDIIYWCTVYGDSEDLLLNQIKNLDLPEGAFKRIKGFKFKDWGRFSKEFLTLQGCDKESGEIMSLIRALWETSFNIMELINSDRFTFKDELEKNRGESLKTLSELIPEDLDGYYFSAPVKRMIWQTTQIIKEIEKILGCPPKRIFIEMTRSEGEKGDKGRKSSRKQQFLELYKNINDEMHNWKELIEEADNSGKLKSKKMFLYLTQMGRDMYTGKEISLDDLFNDNLYDIDHIYPRHFVKDDNLSNNLVLVNKPDNAGKTDDYPLDSAIRTNPRVVELWRNLKEKRLITEEKYRRLTGSRPFSEEQKADFIARQLVETGQGTKAVADFVKSMMPDTEVVYSKAGNVSEFRNKYKLYKCRSVNDFHHANDAYLNIVVGNVYFTKFTRNPRNFIKNEYMKDRGKNEYNLGKMFDNPVERNGYIAWTPSAKDGPAGTIGTVKTVMAKNTPLLTRMSFEANGEISNATLYSAKKASAGSGYIPLKASDEHMRDLSKYGGFMNVSTAYFTLIEHTVKKKRVRSLEAIPILLKSKIENDEDSLLRYCTDELKMIEPKILIRKVKLQSLLKIDGYFGYLSGKTGNQLVIRNAVQLCLERKWTDYIRAIDKFVENNREEGIICSEYNTELYDILTKKFNKSIYARRPNPIGEKLVKGRDKFVGLSILDQAKLLKSLFTVSLPWTGYSVDLQLIGESKQTGTMKPSKEVSRFTEILLINQSATGLYENQIDLLKL